jgi:hypothetical protein
MDTAHFDFSRFRDYRSKREERIRQFLRGQGSPVLLTSRVHGNYTICRTPRESLDVQLESIARQMEVGSDFVPFLEPWFGVGVYANAFGAEYDWRQGESAQTHYVAHTAEQAAQLHAAPLAQSPAMQLVLDAIDYFLEQTRGEIPIACTDTQSPFDTATLLWDTADFFTSVYTTPDIVHGLLERITDSIELFTRLQMERIGPALARPGHIMLSAQGGPGMSVSDDNIVMVGPEIYREVAVPYNSRLSRAFGGLAVHSCGNYERQLPALLETDELLLVDGAFSARLDPTPNENLELFRDTLKDTGVILQARMGPEWPELLPRLYDPGVRLVLSVPPAPDTDRGANQRAMEQVLGQCA